MNQKRNAIIIITLSILIGTMIRFYPVLQTGFPVNDGGMFMAMIEDVAQANFVLPSFTTYNSMKIPFAYPPLAFYLAAILKKFFDFETIFIMSFLPPLLCLLLFVPFLFFSYEYFNRSLGCAALALMCYFFSPRSYMWMIMGGGLTRSLGMLFFLIFIFLLLRSFKYNKKINAFLAGISGGCVVLSHPEAAVHAIIAGMSFWFLFRNNFGSFKNGIIVSSTAGLIVLPWLIAVIQTHGLSPFLAAMQTSGNRALGLIQLFLLSFTEEYPISLVTSLAVFGIIALVWQRRFFLVAWMAAHLLLSPRSAASFAIIPLSLLAATTLTEIIIPFLDSHSRQRDVFVRLGITLITILGVINFWRINITVNYDVLNVANREAMKWVAENTPPNARVLVLTGEKNVWLQKEAEWFPVLARRQSVATIQGREWLSAGSKWLPAESFEAFENRLIRIQSCIYAELSCLLSHPELVGRVDYIYLATEEQEVTSLPLYHSLKASRMHNLVYLKDNVAIFVFTN